MSNRPKVIIELEDNQASELVQMLEEHKDEHPELHELVYWAMTKALFARMNARVDGSSSE